MMKVISLSILLAVVYMVKSQQSTQPTVNQPRPTGPSEPGYPRGREGVRPWGFARRRQPMMQYDSNANDYPNYYYDYYGMGGGCTCSQFPCRRRFAFRGRCRNTYERPGFRCCYFRFRRFYDDYDFDFFD